MILFELSWGKDTGFDTVEQECLGISLLENQILGDGLHSICRYIHCRFAYNLFEVLLSRYLESLVIANHLHSLFGTSSNHTNDTAFHDILPLKLCQIKSIIYQLVCSLDSGT